MGRVIGVNRMAELRKSWRSCRVVFTNGVFDLIHYGHLKLLQDCKILGDVLIVGLNSDASVRKIKGPRRPIMPFKERSKILAALEPVDYVVSFSDETPLKLIKKLKPDVLVKGSDYKVKEIVGAEEVKGWGGEVRRVKLLPGHSTSELIKKIGKLSAL
ncbi:MAG TPA: D-glycero-beta-D-manno-heptose 1-phosphate adenylyltransferase [candidate division Zixibacteria bacterium]|nr:D-glycero-beta-D-manno-heptose 1-phosphate adenylyltransferase [candidate division Zixibacteria bacterium]